MIRSLCLLAALAAGLALFFLVIVVAGAVIAHFTAPAAGLAFELAFPMIAIWWLSYRQKSAG